MFKNIRSKLFPYSCKDCGLRFRDIDKYHKHWLRCDERLLKVEREEKAIEVIAPVNRKQRRDMAKKNRMIKDWAWLNRE